MTSPGTYHVPGAGSVVMSRADLGHSPSAAQLQVDETDNKSRCWQSTMDATKKTDGEFQMVWSGEEALWGRDGH